MEAQHRETAALSQPAEQQNAHGQTELLTGNTVEQGLEHGRQSRRFEAGEAPHKPVQARIVCRTGVKFLEVLAETQQSLETVVT